jgi:hypothetical protein
MIDPTIQLAVICLGGAVGFFVIWLAYKGGFR